MLDHFERVSIFGPSAVALWLIVAVNWIFTAVHIYEEWKGESVPLWRAFGAIVGVRLPDWLGFAFFTVLLTLVLWTIGLAGIAGWWLLFFSTASTWWGVWALGAVIGARVTDTVVSHWIPFAVGYRPNPGIRSTPLYVVEALFLLYAFWPGLVSEPLAAWLGLLAGAIVFVLVLPAIWVAGLVVRDWRHPHWLRGTVIPNWALA